VDACFFCDSKSLLIIPSKFPSFILMIKLPLISSKAQNPDSASFLDTQRNSKQLINYEARKFGPISIIGPGVGVFGQPLKMTHIASNFQSNSEKNVHFVTWHDDGRGEYCLWKLLWSKTNEKSSIIAKFESCPKLLVPRSIGVRKLGLNYFTNFVPFFSKRTTLILQFPKTSYWTFNFLPRKTNYLF